MPKRSNNFQKLIHLIYQQLEDPDSVTESKLLRNRVTKQLREVDVVIEVRGARTELVVSVECRDRKNPADVEWIEQMKTKHEYLGTHKLVLVSSSGFTQQARVLAQWAGFDLLTLEEAINADWNEGIRQLQELFFAEVHLTPRIWTPSVEYLPEELMPVAEDFEADPVVCNFDGTVRGLLSQFAAEVVRYMLAQESMCETAVPGTERGFILDAEIHNKLYLVNLSGKKLILRRIRIEGAIIAPERIPVKLKHRMFGGVHVAYGAIDHPLGQVLVTIVEEEGGKRTHALRLPGTLAGAEGEIPQITPLNIPPTSPQQT